jgi:hypothetical protein
LSAVATHHDEPCLYLQIDPNGDQEGENEEWFLIFEDGEMLEAAFEAMCQGALRNPDSEEDDEDEGGFFYTADGITDAMENTVQIAEDEDE